jgi:uncharacterized membrane protein YdfJ with MMPL/SSD domain
MPLMAGNDYLILSAAQQSIDQLGTIPWWLWLVILLILLSLLVLGLFVREEDKHRYPRMKKPLPEKASDQTSTGTELESDLRRKTQTKENSGAENP